MQRSPGAHALLVLDYVLGYHLPTGWPTPCRSALAERTYRNCTFNSLCIHEPGYAQRHMDTGVKTSTVL